MISICIKSKREMSLLNVYGPCMDRRGFWDKVVERGMLSHENLIIASDFNFTVNVGEVWGDSAQVDPLVVYFKDLLQGNMLVDIQVDKVVPTRCNGRLGNDLISKRLD